MAEGRRKRRSKEEVAAAREQYLKEKEARQQVRAERQALREAKQQARAERQAAREKLIAERQARKEQREKLKNMTEAERAQARYKIRLEKARKANKKGEVHPLKQIEPYRGTIRLGEWYTIRFAGGLRYGECIQHKSPEDMEEEGQVRVRYDIFLFRTKEPRAGGEFWTYPAKREDVLAEGVMKSEDLGYSNNIKFNGISYY